MPHYRVAREWRGYVIAIDVLSCHTIRLVKAGVIDASKPSKRRARAQKVCDQSNLHPGEQMNPLRPVKRKRRTYTPGLPSFAGCFGRRPASEGGCKGHRLSHNHLHSGPNYCCKLSSTFALRGGVHMRVTANMTLADKAIALDLERSDDSEDSDCELLEVKATLLSRSGAVLDEQRILFATTPQPVAGDTPVVTADLTAPALPVSATSPIAA